jgi:uroporphyrinogen decarboxylase
VTPGGILTPLKGDVVAPPPIWLMRQAGRYLPEYRAVRASVGGFLELCYQPELALEVTLQPIRRFGLDAAILFSDILVVADALGGEVAFVEGEGPKLSPVRDHAAIARLAPGRLHAHLAPVYEAVERIRAELDPAIPLIGFAGAPWTVAAYMVEGGSSKDFAIVRTFAQADPAGFGELIDLLTEATADYLVRQIACGADVVQLFDSWAGALPEGEFERWCVAPAERIVARLREAAPDVPVIVFPRGAGPLYGRFVERVRPAGLGLDTTVPLGWASKALPGVCLQGNLDPITLLVGGSRLDGEVDRILQTMAGRPFIFNLGHGVLPATPPEHVEALVRRVRANVHLHEKD